MAEEKQVIPPKPAPEKVVMPAEFDANHDQTVASMKYGRIDADYLNSLIMEHKADYARDPDNYTVSDKLAQVIRIVILKTLGMKYWRKYSKSWKEEMFFRAEYVALKYIHNYSPAKLSEVSKNNDPYYYIGQIVSRAFMQKVTELTKKSKYIKFTTLNENILHDCAAIDQYAGVLAKEEEKLKEQAKADAALVTTSIDSALERINEVDPLPDMEELAKKAKERKKAKK